MITTTAVPPSTSVAPRLGLQILVDVPPIKRDPNTSLLFEFGSLTKPPATATESQDGLSNTHEEIGNTKEVTPIQEKGRVKKMVAEIKKSRVKCPCSSTHFSLCLCS
jgi:hypothetical protein